jgi:hypothetical protein
MIFWGLSSSEININIFYAMFLYFIINIIVLIIQIPLFKSIFDNQKDTSIVTVSALIGNTGNLGIPLLMAIYGNESVIYTSMINLCNVFIVYTIGVYFYARGNFSAVESIKSIFKIPVLYFAIIALTFNILEIKLPKQIDNAITMGAYTSMVIQLIIFGIYLYSVKVKEIELKITITSILSKFILVPLIAFVVVYLLDVDKFVAILVILQLSMPLAIANVNLSSLYDCKPLTVTYLVLITSILFIPYILVILYLLNSFFVR